MPNGYIDGLDDLVLRATGGGSGSPEQFNWFKTGTLAGATPATPVNGKMTSLWQHDGYPCGGSAPGAVRIPTRATAGALGQTDPASTYVKWMTSSLMGAYTTAASGVITMYDRLLDISGLSATTITAQTVGGTITRNTGGIGNEIWVEIYTQIGATATTITVAYTDTANVSQVTPAFTFGGTAFREAQRILVLPLVAGGVGVKSIQSVTVLATTGTAGDFGITMARRLCRWSGQTFATPDYQSIYDYAVPIDTGACLAFTWIPISTTQTGWIGQLNMVDA